MIPLSEVITPQQPITRRSSLALTAASRVAPPSSPTHPMVSHGMIRKSDEFSISGWIVLSMLSRFDTGLFPMFFSPSTRIENEPNNPSQSQDNYKYNDGSRTHNDYSLFAWIGALWSLRVGTYSSARVVPEGAQIKLYSWRVFI